VDILNPVQIAAANMDPVKLKREFGDRLIFWGGGCDTQGVLGRVPADEVRRHVRQNVSVYGHGGGYVFNQVHNIQSDVPTDNIIAMLEAAYEAAGTAAGG
jgi:uroporphyrinogen decarboxylase